jgi:predicted MPP superfamily phosphohydrolase
MFLACKGKPDSKQESTTKENIDAKAGAQIEASKGTTTAKFLALSDVHINGNMSGTAYGNVTGTQLWSRAKTKIENVIAKEQPKFMVYLGDLPAYIDSERAQNSHTMLENLRNLQIDIPILYLPGNNDSLEGDYHSFTNGTNNSVITNDFVAGNNWPVLNANSTKITVSNLDFNKEFGYYSVDLIDTNGTLKVIALNTVIFSSKEVKDPETGNYHIAYNSKKNSAGDYTYGDDGISQQAATEKQMHWLETTLNKLGKNDRVLLMMHIPIGIDGYGGTAMWNADLTFTNSAGTMLPLHDGFIELLSKKQPNIVGLLNGHTHMDGLRRIYKTPAKPPRTSNKPGDMISFSISTPGIAVNHDNNPGFKLFTYDTSNYDLLDFTTYYAVPTDTSKQGDFKFTSNTSYTFNDTFEVTNTNTPIFETLANQTEAIVIQNVNKIYGAMALHKNKQTGKEELVTLNFGNAVDVHKK